MELIPHPAWPAAAVDCVDVGAEFGGTLAVLTYRVHGAVPAMGSPAAPLRTDELWKHTCFELFVMPAGGEAYFEFNFAPSTQWAAYRFDGYRDGMTDLPLEAPTIEQLADGVRVSVDLSGLPRGEWRVGITAVIEETDGTKSYWALAHPARKPDFHYADGFVLTV